MESAIESSQPLVSSWTNGWNPGLEQALREKEATCLSFKWMHNRQSDRYLEIHKWLTNIVVFLVLLTTGSFFGTASFTNSSKLWVRILLGILGLATAYLAKRYGDENYGLQSFLHKHASAEWDWTYDLIHNELNYSTQHRQAAKDFKRWIDSHIVRLVKTSPDISSTVLGQYQKAFPQEVQMGFEKVKASQSELKAIVVDSPPIRNAQVDDEEPKETPSPPPSQKSSSQFGNWSHSTESAKQRYEIDRYLRDNIS